jgi:hypothetical protein
MAFAEERQAYMAAMNRFLEAAELRTTGASAPR